MEDIADTTRTNPPRRWGRATALVASGVLAGGILAGTLTATAATDDSTDPSATTTTGETATDETADAAGRPGGRGGGPGAGEEELTGDVADSVEAAVLGAYPEATIVQLETDADGTYEAHIETADGERVTVEVDESFAVTGEEAGGPC